MRSNVAKLKSSSVSVSGVAVCVWPYLYIGLVVFEAVGMWTEAIRFGARLQDVGVIRDAIEQRFAQPGVGNDLRPL